MICMRGGHQTEEKAKLIQVQQSWKNGKTINFFGNVFYDVQNPNM